MHILGNKFLVLEKWFMDNFFVLEGMNTYIFGGIRNKVRHIVIRSVDERHQPGSYVNCEKEIDF